MKRRLIFGALIINLIASSANFLSYKIDRNPNKLNDKTIVNKTKIRIACNIDRSLQFDKLGNVTGFLKDYYDLLAAMNNWEIEYVDASNMNPSESIRKDFDIYLAKSSQEIPNITLSNLVLTYYTPLIVASQDTWIYADDYSHLENLPKGICLNSNSSDKYILNKFEKQKNFNFNYVVEVNSNEEKIEKTALGEVNAMLSSTLESQEYNKNNSSYIGKAISYLPLEKVYLGVDSKNTKLIEAVNSSMEEISNDNQNILTQINKKANQIDSEEFTSAYTFNEQLFISDTDPIKIGFYNDTRPLAFINKNGEPDGIYISYFKEIQRKSGLKFEFVPLERKYFWKTKLQNHEIDYYVGASNDSIADDSELNGEISFMDYQTILVVKKGYNSIKKNNLTIVLTNGRKYWDSYVKSKFGLVSFKYVNSTKDCLLAVAKGEADMTYVNNLEYLYQSQNGRFSSLKQLDTYTKNTKCSLVKLATADSTANSIIQRTKKTITNDNFSNILESYLAIPYVNYSFEDYLYIYRFAITIFLFSLIAIVLVALTIMLAKKKSMKILEETNETLHKSNIALTDAFDAARQASFAKTDFLSKMSHDIRTPMNAIIGMTAIAQNNLDDKEKVASSLKKITSSSKHLLNLINNVLDMSKIESGQTKLKEEEINIEEYFKGLVQMVQPMANEKKQNLHYTIKGINHNHVLGDPVRIQELFINFASNAVKYTHKEGDIAIKVTEIPSIYEGYSQYQMIFQDNGIGMSKEFIEKIFEPFSREEDDRVSKAQGTGLGMAIAKNIATMMNGDIKIESELKKGSKFTVTFHAKVFEKRSNIAEKLKDINVFIFDISKQECIKDAAYFDFYKTPYEFGFDYQDCLDRFKAYHEIKKDFSLILIYCDKEKQEILKFAEQIKKIVENRSKIIIMNKSCDEIDDYIDSKDIDDILSIPIVDLDFEDILDKYAKEKETKKDNKLDSLENLDFSSKRVLLVEDNDLNREIANEILSLSSINIEEAVDGKQAYDKFFNSKIGYYDIILMDIQMPLLNGYESTKLIRDLKRSDAKEIPIIAMTANAFQEDIQNAKNAGMNDHIAKPIDFEKLAKVLAKYLNS